MNKKYSVNNDFSFLLRKNRLAGRVSDLTPEYASRLGAILGSYLGGEEAVVVAARDYRKDTRMVSRAFNAGLISVGTTVFELHATALPVLQFALRRFSAHAGVHFAAAHRSSDKINVRIFDQTGVELPFQEVFAKEKIQKINPPVPEKIADIISVSQANDIYHSAINSALKLDSLKEKAYSIVVDCSLGPVAEIFPNILARLGLHVQSLNSYKPASIPDSLPSPESLSITSRAIIAAKADLGIVFDPVGSKVLFLDEHGRIIDPYIVVTILLKQKMIGRERGAVVLSETLWPIHSWLKENDLKPHFVKDFPGEISKAIQFNRAIFGASEKGEYIHPTFSNESEAIVTALLFLWAFSRSDEHKYVSSYTEANDIIDALYLTEEHYTLNVSAAKFFSTLYESDSENKIINTLNGIKIIYSPRAWVYIFPIIVSSKIIIRACAEKQEERKKMIDESLELIKVVEEKIAKEKETS